MKRFLRWLTGADVPARPTDLFTHRQLEEFERRAPGYIARCTHCGLTLPYGWRRYFHPLGWPLTVGSCGTCKRIRLFAVERRAVSFPIRIE